MGWFYIVESDERMVIIGILCPSGEIMPILQFCDIDEFRHFASDCLAWCDNNSTSVPDSFLNAFKDTKE